MNIINRFRGLQRGGVPVLAREPHSAVESGLVLTAVAALLLGAAVYLLDRDWADSLFLESFTDYQWSRSAIFGALGGFLPALLHAYAFPVSIMVALSPWPWTRPWVCLLWFIMASFLEWLQTDSAGSLFLATNTPPCDVPLSGYLQRYALQGEFDCADLMATGIGCLTALVVTIVNVPQRHGSRV